MLESQEAGSRQVALAFGPVRDQPGTGRAVLRPLTGRDEIELAMHAARLPVEQAVQIAACSCTDLAGIARPGVDVIATLTGGDLNRLLIAIQCLNFGPAVDAVATCSAPDCQAGLEIDLDLDRMLDDDPSPTTAPRQRIDIEIGGRPCWLDLAVPRVDVIQTAARRAVEIGADAAQLLLEATLVGVGSTDGKRALGRKRALSRPEVRRRIEDWVLSTDRFARLDIRGLCPRCGAATSLFFDPGSFLLARLRRHGSILDEVDRMAMHYHWSEADILALPMARRQAYLARIEARLGDGADLADQASARGAAA